MREQSDLLAWQPTDVTADIVAFPQRRNLGRARKVAATVAKKLTQASRQSYFNRALRDLGNSLEAAGLCADQIDRELNAFTGTVNGELWRIEGRQRPGGAA